MSIGIVRHVPRTFKLAGVPIRVSRTWALVMCVITGITLDTLAPDRDGAELALWYLGAGVVAFGIAGSLLAHCYAHAYAAKTWGGSLRAYEPALLGNLSDAAYPPVSPGAEAIVAVAGPLASLGLGSVCFGLALALDPASSALAAGLTILALANLVLLAAGLIPGFPYDGGRALRAFIWYLSDDLVTGTKVAVFYGQFLAVFGFVIALVALVAGEPYSVFGAWGIMFLWAAQRSSHDGLERTVWAENARTTAVSDLVIGASTRIGSDETIDAAIDEVLQAARHGPILVTDNGEITGVFSLSCIRRIPRAIWTERQVRDVASTLDSLPRIRDDAPATELLDLFDSTGSDLVLVESAYDGRLLGALDQEIAEHRLRDRISAVRRTPPVG